MEGVWWRRPVASGGPGARARRARTPVSPLSLLFWTVRPIVAIGVSGLRLHGVNLIGDAADWEGAALGAVAPQFLHDVFVIVRAIVVGETGKGLGQNGGGVYVFQPPLPGDIQPKGVEEGDVLILHGGRVWADAKGVDDAFGVDDLEYKLLFGFGYGFPGGAGGERLFGGAHFAGDAGGDGGRLKVVGGLGDGGPGVTSWDHQQ